MSYDKPRINDFNMSMSDVVYALSDGNPGAITVMAQMIEQNARIDPDDAFGALGPLMALDTLDVYGSDIWMLYKDVCGHSLVEMLAVLRANQLGFLEETVLKSAIAGETKLDTFAILKQVQKRLKAFGK